MRTVDTYWFCLVPSMLTHVRTAKKATENSVRNDGSTCQGNFGFLLEQQQRSARCKQQSVHHRQLVSGANNSSSKQGLSVLRFSVSIIQWMPDIRRGCSTNVPEKRNNSPSNHAFFLHVAATRETKKMDNSILPRGRRCLYVAGGAIIIWSI